jgi:uncharacterized membrane protein
MTEIAPGQQQRRFNWARPSDKAYIFTWLSWAVLLIVQLVDTWLYQLPLIVLIGRVLPLLIFLPGMLKDNLRSYIWLCFVSLLYFIALVERLFAQPGSVLAALGMLSVVTLFIAAMMFVRWRARDLKTPLEQESSEVGEK